MQYKRELATNTLCSISTYHKKGGRSVPIAPALRTKNTDSKEQYLMSREQSSLPSLGHEDFRLPAGLPAARLCTR